MRRIITAVGVLFAIGFAVTTFFPPYAQDIDASQYAGLQEARLQIRAGETPGEMYYVSAGAAQGPLILFIHGTPGSWHAYENYLAHPQLAQAKLVAMDRPGFGRSAQTGVMPDLADQARAMALLIQAEGRPAMIVGHSLGGSIAYQLAADFPELVAGLVIIAASLDPDLGGPRWYNYLGALVTWLLPGDLANANREIMPLGRSLRALEPTLGNIRAPMVVLHGEDDNLVSVAHLDYVKQHLPHARIQRYSDAGHFILWEQPTLIVKAIQSLLEPQ